MRFCSGNPMPKPRSFVPRRLRTYSLRSRISKVHLDDFAKPWTPGCSFLDFLDRLPAILAVPEFNAVVDAVVKARRSGRLVVVGIGAHVIKVGLSPVLIDLMERGIVGAIAMNGAGIIHDFELAFAGHTSEDVAAGIGKGAFGMARETGEMLNRAIRLGVRKGWGIGRSVGEMIERKRLPHRGCSLLATAARFRVPATVHVAIGTDIIHMHPAMDGAATGEATLTDFRLLTDVVCRLDRGVYLNIGSAVILPEVFLKALTLARNRGRRVERLTTVNMDFIQHYRPVTNVVRRPTQNTGRGITLTGHHEIMVPLLAAAVLERLGKRFS